MKLIQPKKLQKGDTILFVSPSAGLHPMAPHRLEEAKKFLENQGYVVRFSKHALENGGYTSASPQERAEDINDGFKDSDVSAIIATIGGNHSNQILKYLDFDLIKNNPKIFVGYSDISVLHYALMTQSGLATFYGPCGMTQFGEYPEPLSYTWNNFLKEVSDDADNHELIDSEEWTQEILNWFDQSDQTRPRQLHPNPGRKWLSEGESEGTLMGGCIPSINHLIGTKYWPNHGGSILFIDIPEGNSFDEGLSTADLDSYMADLDNLGLFEKINGLLVGRPVHYTQEQIVELEEIIRKYTEQYSYPVVTGLDIGHTDPMFTLQYGSKIMIKSSDNSIIINHE